MVVLVVDECPDGVTRCSPIIGNGRPRRKAQAWRCADCEAWCGIYTGPTAIPERRVRNAGEIAGIAPAETSRGDNWPSSTACDGWTDATALGPDGDVQAPNISPGSLLSECPSRLCVWLSHNSCTTAQLASIAGHDRRKLGEERMQPEMIDGPASTLAVTKRSPAERPEDH